MLTTEQEVVSLVAKKTGIAASRITAEKTFYDLGIDGDDAVELVASCANGTKCLLRA